MSEPLLRVVIISMASELEELRSQTAAATTAATHKEDLIAAFAAHDLRSATPDETIEIMEDLLVEAYRARRGRMVDGEWGYCVGCGKVKVCAADGDDTCGNCLEGA